jgi:hypothetical protein
VNRLVELLKREDVIKEAIFEGDVKIKEADDAEEVKNAKDD